MIKYHYSSVSFDVDGLGTFYRCRVIQAIDWAGFGDIAIQKWTCYITEEQYNRFKGKKTISEQELQEILGRQVKMTEQDLLEQINKLEEEINNCRMHLQAYQQRLELATIDLEDYRTALKIFYNIQISKTSDCHHKD